MKITAKIDGWVLVAKDDDAGWYIAWLDFFRSKKRALEFAKKNNWPKPYQAIRGEMVARS